jgi:CheY-like chemotaxis protein
MKAALEPAKSSARVATLTVTGDGSSNQVVLGQARGTAGGGKRILTVVLAPADLRGIAYLVKEEPTSDNDNLWIWIPAIGRVRNVVSPEAYSAFLNSDYTYSDLGFVSLRPTYKPVKEETVGGAKAWVIDGEPQQKWYYTRIVSTIAAATSLPIERKFYDPANQLWKVETFAKVAVIDGVPTVMTTKIDDIQSKNSSTLNVTDVRYDVEIPAGLLEPMASRRPRRRRSGPPEGRARQVVDRDRVRRVHLPRHVAAAGGAAAIIPTPMRILVVEDEPKVASFVRRALEGEHHAVDVASDGAAGLAQAVAGPTTSSCLDVMLPKRDGSAELRELRDRGTPCRCCR